MLSKWLYISHKLQEVICKLRVEAHYYPLTNIVVNTQSLGSHYNQLQTEFVIYYRVVVSMHWMRILGIEKRPINLYMWCNISSQNIHTVLCVVCLKWYQSKLHYWIFGCPSSPDAVEIRSICKDWNTQKKTFRQRHISKCIGPWLILNLLLYQSIIVSPSNILKWTKSHTHY